MRERLNVSACACTRFCCCERAPSSVVSSTTLYATRRAGPRSRLGGGTLGCCCDLSIWPNRARNCRATSKAKHQNILTTLRTFLIIQTVI
eukprot:2092273-Pleurochrysis_carterae.AAC.5